MTETSEEESEHEDEILKADIGACIRKGISASLTDSKFMMQKYSHSHDTQGDLGDKESIFLRNGKRKYLFRSYCKQGFKEVRRRFGVTDDEFERYLGENSEAFSGGPSKGKSKSFIYFTSGHKFVLKTMNHAEAVFLRRISRSYLTHIRKNPNTLLSRFYAMFAIKLNVETLQEAKIPSPTSPKIYMCVMNNVFETCRTIDYKFDLKGSTHGRCVSKRDLAHSNNLKSLIFKDLDFVGKNRALSAHQVHQGDSSYVAPRKIFLGDRMKLLFLQQLRNDSSWLAQNQIMDYSLLCGISVVNPTPSSPDTPAPRPPETPPCLPLPEVKKPQQRTLISLKSTASERSKKKLRELAVSNTESPTEGKKRSHPSAESNLKSVFEQSLGGVVSSGGPQNLLYYFGIIDICQEYNLRKKAETNVRSLVAETSSISAVPPHVYAKRFYDFLASIST